MKTYTFSLVSTITIVTLLLIGNSQKLVEDCLLPLGVNRNCKTCDQLISSRVYDLVLQTTICSTVIDCAITTNQVCTSCRGTDYQLVDTAGILKCVLFPGCLSLNKVTSLCQVCRTGWQLQLPASTCSLISLSRCLVFQTGKTNCQTCKFPWKLPLCDTVDQSLCLAYNYVEQVCLKCPVSYVLINQVCQLQIKGCLEYSLDATKCFKCKDGLFNSLSGQCLLSLSVTLLNEVVYQKSTNTGLVPTKTQICRSPFAIWDPVNQICSKNINTKQYGCGKQDSLGKCLQCSPGYKFISSTTYQCQKCSTKLQYCLYCTRNQCLACQQGYFLSMFGNCLACSSLGFKSCFVTSGLGVPISLTPSALQANSPGLILPIECPLYSYPAGRTCFVCPPGQGMVIQSTISCTKCSLANCAACNQDVCQWCTEEYYLSEGKLSCNKLTTKPTPLLKVGTAFTLQILTKLFPGSEFPMSNSMVTLLSNCNGTFNMYHCVCNRTFFTSLCVTQKTDLLSLYLPNLVFSQLSDFLANLPTALLVAQYPSFSCLALPLTTSITYEEASHLLQYYTRCMKDTNSLVTAVQQLMARLFLDELLTASVSAKPFVVFGNGYKLYLLPTGDYMDNIVSIRASTAVGTVGATVATDPNPTCVFMVGLNSSLLQIGHTNKNNKNLTIVLNNPLPQQLATNRPAFNYSINQKTTITVNQIPLTLNLGPSDVAYLVALNSSQTAQLDSYSTLRIENVFYRQSSVYVLLFIILYLIFIPLCVSVDCCKRSIMARIKDNHRNRVNTTEQEPPSQSNKDPDSSSSEEHQKPNIYQFLPIYNVAATPRSRRLGKLLLYLLNLQHPVTILLLILFQAPPYNPVVSLLLAVPAYFATIFLNYLCGASTIYLPRVIRLIVVLCLPPLYWLLWLLVFPLFQAADVKVILHVMVVLFTLLDAIFEGIEMILVFYIFKAEGGSKLVKWIGRIVRLKGFYDEK